MRSAAVSATAPTAEEIRELAAFAAGDSAVVSLYLNTDGRRLPRRGDYELNLSNLTRQAKSTSALPRAARASVDADLEAIREYVTKEFERSDTRGLAFFTCRDRGLWRMFRLPVPVRDRVIVDGHPHVLRLEALVTKAEVFATLLVNRERARIFVTRLGVTSERSEVLDEVPGQHGQGGWSQANYSRHIEEIVHRHCKHVAEVTFALSKREPFDHLILAGPEELLRSFEKGLHTWLASRVVARISLPVNATKERVREATMAVQEVVDSKRADADTRKLLDEFAAGGPAVVGLDRTLDAVQAGRVDTLVLADGETGTPGWRCPNCGRLAQASTCPECGAEGKAVSDLVEEMVDEALRRRCRVVAADARPLPQSVGALLRF